MNAKYIFITAGLLVLAGCSGPKDNLNLQAANAEYQVVSTNPAIVQNAPVELKKAKEELDKANSNWKNEEDDDVLEHQIYVARSKIALAKEKAAIKTADADIEAAQANRDATLLNAKEQEIQRLNNELAELNAQKSDRGMVVTLSNVLFAVDKAQLLPGAQRQIDQLADFLNAHEDRSVNVEGFTDSTGSDDYNYDLSQRRADAVAAALSRHGIDLSRVKAIGYGEAYPVASNDTPAGRQQNRRVEIIISNPGESVAERH